MKKFEYVGEVFEREITDFHSYCEFITDVKDGADKTYFTIEMEKFQGKRVRITVEVIGEETE